MPLTVSVIIPTYNSEKDLARLLKSLQEQSMSFELIVIDSSSTDRSVEISNAYTENILIIPQNEFDHGGTRTKVSKRAKGDVIVFLTQDAVLFDDISIERLVRRFDDDNVSVCYGQQVPHKGTGPFGVFLRQFNYPNSSNDRVYANKKEYGLRAAFVSNSFCAYRKSCLEAIGYFEDNLILAEDLNAAAKILRVGGKVCYIADAKVYHSHDYDVWQEFERYFDIGVFHALKPGLQEEFGSAAGEGRRYVHEELHFLIHTKKIHLIPLSLFRNGMKLLAYKLGKNYRLIPKILIPYFSMHKNWWYKQDRLE